MLRSTSAQNKSCNLHTRTHMGHKGRQHLAKQLPWHTKRKKGTQKSGANCGTSMHMNTQKKTCIAAATNSILSLKSAGVLYPDSEQGMHAAKGDGCKRRLLSTADADSEWNARWQQHCICCCYPTSSLRELSLTQQLLLLSSKTQANVLKHALLSTATKPVSPISQGE